MLYSEKSEKPSFFLSLLGISFQKYLFDFPLVDELWRSIAIEVYLERSSLAQGEADHDLEGVRIRMPVDLALYHAKSQGILFGFPDTGNAEKVEFLNLELVRVSLFESGFDRSLGKPLIEHLHEPGPDGNLLPRNLDLTNGKPFPILLLGLHVRNGFHHLFGCQIRSSGLKLRQQDIDFLAHGFHAGSDFRRRESRFGDSTRRQTFLDHVHQCGDRVGESGRLDR